jgi:hypothetical protein
MPAATLTACSPKARLSTGSADILICNMLLQVVRSGNDAKKANALLATCNSSSTEREDARIIVMTRGDAPPEDLSGREAYC